MKRKIVSVLLCILLLASLLPVSAFADTTASGTCGANLTWTLDDSGTLTISGTGEINGYRASENSDGDCVTAAPWGKHYKSIKSLIIENGVTGIGSSAFWGCSNMTSATVPNSVIAIGDWAFSDCDKLENIVVEEGNANYCSVDGVVFNKNQTSVLIYPAGKAETSYIIPDGVTSIGDWAFERCSGLTSVTIGNGVTSIGEYAFYECSSLTSVTIPKSVTSIGWFAFLNCSGLKDVYYSGSAADWAVISIGDYNKNLNDAELHCADGSYIYHGNCGAAVFWGIDSSDTLTVSGTGSMDNYATTENADGIFVTTAPWREHYKTIKIVIIEDGVTSIGGSAFERCSGLTSATIGNSVTSIGEYAFYECSSLTSVTIGSGVTTIGDYAFTWCSSLTSVTIPDSVTSIGSCAFDNCSSLESVTIGNSVRSIGHYAFGGCSKLKDIAFAGSKDAWASIEKGDEAFSTSTRIHYNCTTLDGHIIPMERKDPNCTSTGYIKYSCACGYEYTELLPENHDYVFIKSVAATCSNAGYDVYKCSKCGNILNKSNGEEQLPHDYELTKAVEPTCTEHGYDVYKCTVCGTSKTETRNDELLPHDYVVTVVEPTCLKGGYTLYKCSVCGDEYKDDLTPLLGHSMVEVGEKPATCAEVGHTAGVQCSRCGLVESGVTEIPALGHSYGNWTQTKAPTCTAKGTETGRCTRCNAAQTRDVAALGHSYGAWTQTKAPTCTAKGTETRNCTRCNASETRDVAALGHSYGNWTQTKAPTCTAKGTETRNCTRCNASETRDVNTLGHSYKNGKCTICGAADPNYIAAPALSITTSAGKPKIYWNAVDGAVKYWVYRSTDGKKFSYYDSTTKTSYTNSSTSIGTTYYYKVKAVKANGATSDYSVSKSILCKPAAPSVSINRSNGKPKLSWKAVSGATKYWIYRSTDGVNFKYFDSTTKTSYTNSGAASGTKYYYRVKAVAVVNGKNVTSANSSTKSLFTSLAKPSVSITTSNGKPKLTWKAVTGADKYYVYRSTDGKNFSYWDSTTKTSYVNSGAKKNTKYYYKVKAVCASNSNANSAQSAAVSIKATK